MSRLNVLYSENMRSAKEGEFAAALRKAMVRDGLCVEARKSPAHFVDIDTGFSVYRDDVPLRQCFKNRDMTSDNPTLSTKPAGSTRRWFYF